MTYNVKTDIAPGNEVLDCSCSCPAGSSPGSCKHVFAMLHTLEEYSREELYLASTEKLQSWHKPKPSKFSPKKCSDLFTKPKLLNVDYDALFTGDKNLQYMSVVSECGNYTKNHTIPLPAVILSNRPESALITDDITHLWFLIKNLSFDLNKIWELEEKTRDQHLSDLWKKERLNRLTASNFYSVCRRTKDFNLLAKQIIENHGKNLYHISAIAYGIDNEPFVRNCIRNLFKDGTIRKVGLVSNSYMPHLAASPDGLIHSDDNTMLFEIKCKVNYEKQNLEQLSANSNFCLEKNEFGKWTLKKSHKFYYQIQGQLALSNLKKCVFAFFYKQPNFIFTETIEFDETFWNSMYEKLTNFYLNYYLPQLILLPNSIV